jgi:hypothetical protein
MPADQAVEIAVRIQQVFCIGIGEERDGCNDAGAGDGAKFHLEAPTATNTKTKLWL